LALRYESILIIVTLKPMLFKTTPRLAAVGSQKFHALDWHLAKSIPYKPFPLALSGLPEVLSHAATVSVRERLAG
jgi:hypothetical protein